MSKGLRITRVCEIAMRDEMSLSELQRHQPWTVPYSPGVTDALKDVPHLLASHAVLHAAKSVGKLAAVFEAADHGGSVDLGAIQAMAADLVTAAMRLGNLYSFDLQSAMEQRVREKNGVGFEAAALGAPLRAGATPLDCIHVGPDDFPGEDPTPKPLPLRAGEESK